MRKLTDAAHVFQGHNFGMEILIVSKNGEDVLILNERLKIIKNANINEAKTLQMADIEQRFTKAPMNHLILLIDDIK